MKALLVNDQILWQKDLIMHATIFNVAWEVGATMASVIVHPAVQGCDVKKSVLIKNGGWNVWTRATVERMEVATISMAAVNVVPDSPVLRVVQNVQKVNITHVRLWLIYLFDLGTWGRGCNRVCQCSWKNSESCDTATGRCLCRAGFTGTHCTERLLLYFTLPKKLILNLVCKDGRWGRGCQSDCNCDGYLCDKSTGECICPPGLMAAGCKTGKNRFIFDLDDFTIILFSMRGWPLRAQL